MRRGLLNSLISHKGGLLGIGFLVLLILLALPVAMVVNSVRVFLTGFLVFFVDPKLGEGFMHLSEGWLLFVVAFLILGGFTWLVSRAETALLGADDAA